MITKNEKEVELVVSSTTSFADLLHRLNTRILKERLSEAPAPYGWVDKYRYLRHEFRVVNGAVQIRVIYSSYFVLTGTRG